jgi:hypothetical protein
MIFGVRRLIDYSILVATLSGWLAGTAIARLIGTAALAIRQAGTAGTIFIQMWHNYPKNLTKIK